MQVNLNLNSSSTNRTAPSFGQINFRSGSKEILNEVLELKELKEVSKLVNKQMKNPVDINMFGEGFINKCLKAKIVSTSERVADKQLDQRIFESAFGFIKRCCKEADKLKTKLNKIGDTNIDDILNKA